jgi:hypothetical protein
MFIATQGKAQKVNFKGMRCKDGIDPMPALGL